MGDSPLLTPEEKGASLLTPEEERRRPPGAKRARSGLAEADEASLGLKGGAGAGPDGPGAGGDGPAKKLSRCEYRGGFATTCADKYTKKDKVGVGAYGSVFKAEHEETKEIVAIKAAGKKEDPLYGGFPVSVLREISILRQVRHENIVEIYEIAATPSGDPLIVMEYCEASLLELLNSPKHGLSFSEIKYVSRQLLDATGHLHKHGILHRDLATKNVLFNLSGEIKVCDFGISRVAFGRDEEFGQLSAKDLENPNQIVSLPYRAIELLLGDPKYGPALDVWSLGCIFAEIICSASGRRQPFFGGNIESPNKTPAALVEEIFTILGRPTSATWPGLKKLPLFDSFNTTRVAAATPHRERAEGESRGDEPALLQRWFRSGEGKCADTKYRLTESCFDLLGGLFTLNPADRISTDEALQHPFFTQEKPAPEWHAWHWALASKEIPRGDKMKRGGDEGVDRVKLLRQLSKEEVKGGEESAKDEDDTGRKLSLAERWAREAEKKKKEQEEAKQRAAEADRQRRQGQAAAAKQKLPPGWTAHWSSSQGKYYYHDSKSGKNSWKLPSG